jgi:hypothetical protein
VSAVGRGVPVVLPIVNVWNFCLDAIYSPAALNKDDVDFVICVRANQALV